MEKPKLKTADQDGRYSGIITQFVRHVTSSPNDVAILGRTIYPPSLVVIDLILKCSLILEKGENITFLFTGFIRRVFFIHIYIYSTDKQAQEQFLLQ